MRAELEVPSESIGETEPGDSDIRLSVVLPVYNENGNIDELTEELLQVLYSEACADYLPVEILFVDDGSTDGTLHRLHELASEFNPVKVIRLRRNFGQSAALSAGIDYARGNVIVTMDADLQNDPSDIPRLLEKYEEGYDCVSGWRKERKDPISKRIPSRIQTYVARLTGPDIHDFGCTLKVYNSEAIQEIELYGEGHRYIPAKLHKLGYRITEIPVNHRERAKGSTKYGANRLVKGFVDLLFNVFWNWYSTRPLHVFGGAGVLFSGVGLLIGSHALFIRYVLGVPLNPRTPRLILVAALILFGMQLMLFGILAEMLTRLYYRDSRAYRVAEVIDDGD